MFLWSPIALPMATEGYTFKKLTAVRHPQKVYNVIPGDFTQDGRLDLLVYGQSSNSNEVSVQLYVALPQGKFGEYCLSLTHIPLSERVTGEPIDAPASISAQPIPMDMNGDLRIDLFGSTSSASASSPFKVWQNVWNASNPNSQTFNVYVYVLKCLCVKTLNQEPSVDPKFNGAHCTLSNPHSNAAVDLNGDCLAGMRCPHALISAP